jgi:predicted AAA+ superfamily ATPase
MQIFNRILNLEDLLKKKSFFLFGPRSTGKSYLIRETLSSKAKVINLLKTDEFLELNSNPSLLRNKIDHKKVKLVVIDEIQKIPLLLNEVHSLIEEYGIHFLLTGSSVRKLKGKDINMLGGRARRADIFPLTTGEIKNFQLMKYLRYGGLPFVVNSVEPQEDLSAYVYNYLNEEIKFESNIRKLDFFQRFLQIAALTSSEMINYSNIASDIGVSEPTVKNYYEILEDTLIGFQLLPWRGGKSRKSVATSKFYFFDTGVLNTILRTPQELDKNSDIFGKIFEQFIAQELRAYISYRRLDVPFNFWRSLQKHEVDFIIDGQIAIEVKSATKVKPDHLKGLRAIKDEGKITARYLISFDSSEKHFDGIVCMHWESFLKDLWKDQIILRSKS